MLWSLSSQPAAMLNRVSATHHLPRKGLWPESGEQLGGSGDSRQPAQYSSFPLIAHVQLGQPGLQNMSRTPVPTTPATCLPTTLVPVAIQLLNLDWTMASLSHGSLCLINKQPDEPLK